VDLIVIFLLVTHLNCFLSLSCLGMISLLVFPYSIELAMCGHVRWRNGHKHSASAWWLTGHYLSRWVSIGPSANATLIFEVTKVAKGTPGCAFGGQVALQRGSLCFLDRFPENGPRFIVYYP